MQETGADRDNAAVEYEDWLLYRYSVHMARMGALQKPLPVPKPTTGQDVAHSWPVAGDLEPHRVIVVEPWDRSTQFSGEGMQGTESR